jgi:hypothetical protein
MDTESQGIYDASLMNSSRGEKVVGNLDDEQLRAMARETSGDMNERIARHQEVEHVPLEQRVDALEARQAEAERVLGIRRDEYHEIWLEVQSSGDYGLLYTWMEDHKITPDMIAEWERQDRRR